MYVAGGPLDPGHRVQLFAQLRAQQVYIDVRLHQQVAHGPTLLVEQGRHQVGRLDELVVTADSQALGIRQRLLKLACHLVHTHNNDSPRVTGIYLYKWGLFADFQAHTSL